MTKQLSRSLQIVHEVPPHVPLPVANYGGTERVVQSLVKGLEARGVNIQVRCSGDSFPDAEDRRKFQMVPNCDAAFGMDATFWGPKKVIEASLYDVFSYAANRNAEGLPTLVHAHTEDTHLMFARCFNTRAVVTTVHNAPKPWVRELFSDFPMVAISKAQAKSLNDMGFDFVRTVYNGIDQSLYTPNFDVAEDAPLVFLGRIGAKKGADLAVEIAIKSGCRLILAGPEDAEEPEFFKRHIQPALDKYPNLISYAGEVSDLLQDGQTMSPKCKLLREAKALLFPIRWKEPFGMVMPEAMACGTPVIALNHPGSSVEEIVDNGVNGFKVNTVDDAARVARSMLGSLDRRRVYKDFINRFSVDRMTEGYMAVYKEVQEQYLPQRPLCRPKQQASYYSQFL